MLSSSIPRYRIDIRVPGHPDRQRNFYSMRMENNYFEYLLPISRLILIAMLKKTRREIF